MRYVTAACADLQAGSRLTLRTSCDFLATADAPLSTNCNSLFDLKRFAISRFSPNDGMFPHEDQSIFDSRSSRVFSIRLDRVSRTAVIVDEYMIDLAA